MAQRRFDYLDKVEFRRSDIADPPWETGTIDSVNTGPEFAYTVAVYRHKTLGREYYDVVEDTDRQIRFLSDQAYEAKVCGDFLKYLSNRKVYYIDIDEFDKTMYYGTFCLHPFETCSIHMDDSTNGIVTVMGSILSNQSHHGIKGAYIRLDNMTWTNNAFGTLVDGLLSSQDLKRLFLRSSRDYSDGVITRRLGTMMERIRETRSLQSLRLHNCCVPCLAGVETFLHELEIHDCVLKRDDMERHTGTLIQTEDFPMSRFGCIVTCFRFPEDFCCFFRNGYRYLTSLDIGLSNKMCSGLGRMLRTTRSLKELKLGVNNPWVLTNIITAMQTNESVEELTLSFDDFSFYTNRSFYTKTARILANQLVCFQKARCIDIVRVFKPKNDSIMKTMQSILAEKIYVEQLTWEESNTSNEIKAQVELFCRVNRRLNEPHLAKLFKCPGKIPLELWPYLLASVSLKASGLFSMLSCYPSLFDAVAKAKENKLKEDIKFWKRLFAWSLFSAIVLPP